MADTNENAAHWEAEHPKAGPVRVERPRGRPMFAWFVFALARLWVVCLLLVAAAVAGISLYQYAQTQQELSQLRESPGEAAYSVVAYRRELAHQIEAIDLDEADYVESETLPTPPERPRLLVEIDNLRERNATERNNRRASSRADTGRPRYNEQVPD